MSNKLIVSIHIGFRESANGIVSIQHNETMNVEMEKGLCQTECSLHKTENTYSNSRFRKQLHFVETQFRTCRVQNQFLNLNGITK